MSEPITNLEDAVHAMGALPMPIGTQRTWPPALPWATTMDDEDLSDFLDELADAAGTPGALQGALAAVEDTIARWRVIAEAQHAHNTAPGPDSTARKVTPSQAPRTVAAEGEHYAVVHHDYRQGRDLPETGGAQ
jgi:hypothetical protein